MTLLETIEPLLAAFERLIERCNEFQWRIAAAERTLEVGDPAGFVEYTRELRAAKQAEPFPSGAEVIAEIRARLTDQLQLQNRLTKELLRRTEERPPQEDDGGRTIRFPGVQG
jgi:hypothetical protein